MNVLQTLIIAHRIVKTLMGPLPVLVMMDNTTTDNGITCDGIILPIFEILFFEVITNLLNAILLLIYYSRFCSVFDSLAWLDTCGYKNYINEYIEFFQMWMNVVQTLIIAHRIVKNTDGSFTCSCNDGYTTTDNGNNMWWYDLCLHFEMTLAKWYYIPQLIYIWKLLIQGFSITAIYLLNWFKDWSWISK